MPSTWRGSCCKWVTMTQVSKAYDAHVDSLQTEPAVDNFSRSTINGFDLVSNLKEKKTNRKTIARVEEVQRRGISRADIAKLYKHIDKRIRNGLGEKWAELNHHGEPDLKKALGPKQVDFYAACRYVIAPALACVEKLGESDTETFEASYAELVAPALASSGLSVKNLLNIYGASINRRRRHLLSTS